MTTDVINCVVGATDEAETTDVTTLVDDAGTVVVLSALLVLRTADDIDEAMEEDMDAWTELIDEETCAEELCDVEVTADIVNNHRLSMSKISKRLTAYL